MANVQYPKNRIRGTFRYPKLTEPDTKFKDEGEYRVEVIASASDPKVKALIKQIDEEAAKSLAAAKEKAKTPAEVKKWETKYLPYKIVEDDETGEPTGDVQFKITMKASGVSKKTGKAWERKPVLFDAKGKRITGEINIGGGTVGIVAYEIIPYAPTTQVGASVKLSIDAVQIIELRSYGERSAEEFGFGEEDGFEADPKKDEDAPFADESGEDEDDF